jgi:glycosyltransferase involved in cell wall biosynthesis
VTAVNRGQIRIVYVLPYLVAGGTEGHVLSLVRRIDRERYASIVVALAGGGELEPEFRRAGVPVHVLGRDGLTLRPGQRGRTFLEALGCVRALFGILRKERPDILHAYLPAANVIGPIAARLSRVRRVIVSKRALADYKEGFPLLRKVESLGNRLADVVSVNSDAVRKDVERTERNWEGKFRKIYNGVAPIESWTPEETRAFRRREGIPGDALVALCVSNFYPYKGHEELVEAAARVVPAFPKVIFLMVGRDSGTMEATRTRVRERGIEGSVRFVGGRTDVPNLLRASDLFVHPSREEGFSNAILEAMSAGLPVVACDVGGNPEAVVDGRTGRLVPPRDPERFAGAMVELIADESKRKIFGEAGLRRAAERFSLDRMVGEMESLYESLARGER